MGPLGYAGLSAGADFAESLAKRIFGSGDRNRILRFAAMLRSRLGTDVISPSRQREIVDRLYASSFGERNRLGESINRRLNLDSGVAQGALGEQAQGQLLGYGANLALENEQLKASRDSQYNQLLTSIYGGLL